jgi:acyl-coenzyme A thioesterase PaaI-like protein
MKPRLWKETLKIRLWALTHVRVLAFVKPVVVELDERRCVIRVPLTWRTRNHLHSMYFAVLAAGADTAGGLMAMRLIQQSGVKVSLIFGAFRAEFHKRAEDDVLFTCEDGERIRAMVDRVVASGERETMPVRVVATVPSKLGEEPVATFELALSLKRK